MLMRLLWLDAARFKFRAMPAVPGWHAAIQDNGKQRTAWGALKAARDRNPAGTRVAAAG
jgi:hypothetical protein